MRAKQGNRAILSLHPDAPSIEPPKTAGDVRDVLANTMVQVHSCSHGRAGCKQPGAWPHLRAKGAASGGKYLLEDWENYGQAITLAVQNEREELRKQGVDADKYFGKKREEYAEALAAR